MNCGYCGRVNPDGSARCCDCGTAFEADVRPEQLEDHSGLQTRLLPGWLKWGLYLAAWGTVVAKTFTTNPKYLLTAPGFPIGLVAIFPKGAEGAVVVAWLGGLAVLIAGWMIYAVLTAIMARTRKASVFFLVYLCFCLLLALNVVGCKRTLEAVAGIQ